MKDAHIKFTIKLYDQLQRLLAWAERKRKETPPMSSKAITLLKVCGVIIVLGLVVYGITYLIPV